MKIINFFQKNTSNNKNLIKNHYIEFEIMIFNEIDI